MKDFYLAGGTALALRYGHRISVDLDFFTASSELEGKYRKELKKMLTETLSFEPENEEEGTLHGRISKTLVSFLRFPYPLIHPPDEWRGMKIASAEDIGLMKLSAIIGRGHRKDFVDLYVILTRAECSLEHLLSQAAKKFGRYHDFSLLVFKALAYFEDGEKNEPLQPLDRTLSWPAIKMFFQREVKILGANIFKKS